jgi:putative chitinase
MAHFLKPPGAKDAGYDVDHRLAPGSVWRVQVLVRGSRKIALWGGAGLRVRSNNNDVVPNSGISEETVGQLRVIKIPGRLLGTSMLEVGQGGDDARNEPIHSVWISLQVQVTDVTADMLREIMPGAGAAADRYVAPLNGALAARGIDAPEQRAAFLAQISVESGQLQRTVENLNYSVTRMRQVWPRRFPTDAEAAPYAGNPEALGNHVYAGRLGNGNEASGDGFRFRGRGLMQITGRANYRRVGFENNPDALSDPMNAATTAAAFWQDNGLNARTTGVLDRAQFDAVSRTVNGGNEGSLERWDAYQRALSALGLAP